MLSSCFLVVVALDEMAVVASECSSAHKPPQGDVQDRPETIFCSEQHEIAAKTAAAKDPVKASCVVRKSLDAASSDLRKLPIAQGHCVVLDVRQNAPDVGRFLCSHSAVLVEIEWRVTHEARRHQCAERQPNRPGRWKSSPPLKCAAAPPAQ